MPAAETQSVVHFDEATHTYKVNGRVVPSVTQVLKAAGLIDDRWFNQAARDRGRIVAIAIELHSKNNLQYVPDGYQGYVNAWVKFLAGTGFVPREVEQPRYNDVYGYAGTVDTEGILWDTPSVVDIKTGCDAPQYAIQTAGYAGFWPEEYHARYCLFLCDDGSYKIRRHGDPHDWGVFMSALFIVHWQREHLK